MGLGGAARSQGSRPLTLEVPLPLCSLPEITPASFLALTSSHILLFALFWQYNNQSPGAAGRIKEKCTCYKAPLLSEAFPHTPVS